MTKLFFADIVHSPYLFEQVKPKYILESFYYIRKTHLKGVQKALDYMQSPHCKEFLLDSGAFTFMMQKNNKSKPDFDAYTDAYIDFINRFDIDLFFELDIDDLVGIEKVEELRQRIESRTGKKSIPVFHLSRGKEYWLKMIEDYDYVAIGGMVKAGNAKKYYKYFDWFLKTAHEKGTRVHALGFTASEGLKRFNFDTVDSTSWQSAGLFGTINKFDGNKLVSIKKPSKNHRLKMHYKDSLLMNLQEWKKFADYLEDYNKRRVLPWKGQSLY